MTIYDLPPIENGIWKVEFYLLGRKVLGVLQGQQPIQTAIHARAIAIENLRRFNPKIEWDQIDVSFTSILSLP